MAEPRIKIEKRNRPPVSCEPCRTRKLKCNRAQPCESCIKRDKVSSCHYAPNATRGKPGPSKTRDLKDRLDTLENLVTAFVSGNISQSALPQRLNDLNIKAVNGIDNSIGEKNGSPNARQTRPPPPDAKSALVASKQQLPAEQLFLQEAEDGQLNYISPGHWESILDDIKEVREHLTGSLSRSAVMHPIDDVQPDASFLFGSDSRTSLADILSSLPPQSQCDALLSAYFTLPYLILAIVHPDKFRREYEAFWISPLTTNPLWLALLFAILSIAAGLRKLSNPTEVSEIDPKVLQQRCVQCLVLGKYAIANEHALEAFVLHMQSMFLSKDEPPVNAWFQMGTIIRLAFRMGYHRDPENLPRVSVFDGEMRRRVWLNIVQTEALLSFQTGFPSMVPVDYCDTRPPRNLHYSDLVVAMTSLPPSRPLSEHTPARYSIIKNSVMSVFRKLVAHTQSMSQPEYSKTLALDAEVRAAYDNIPEEFKRRPINRSFMDPLGTLFERVTIEFLYCKGLIVLHRRYISEDPTNQTYAYSRRSCVEAALDILARQLDLHKACEPGGRLAENRTMVLALPNHEYLLAAMVLCLDLSVRSRLGEEYTRNSRHDEQLDRELTALKTSQQVWRENDFATAETHKACLAIDVMVRKLTNSDMNGQNHTTMTMNKYSDVNEAELASTSGHAKFSSVMFPSWSGQAIMPSMGSSYTTMPESNISMQQMPQMSQQMPANQQWSNQLPWADSMGHMIDGTEIIDWGSLDQYFLLGMEDFNAEYTM